MGWRRGGDRTVPLRPRLREIDLETGQVRRDLDWVAPPDQVPSDRAHQEFTAASWLPDGRLLQPTHTALLWIEPRRLVVERVVSHPLFHGVHSAVAGADGIVVTCAGTESVLELDANGQVNRHHWLREGPFGYPGINDFRTVDHDALKPHSHHPNYACRVGPDLWVTCFETYECRTVGGPIRKIPLPEAIPHDGRLRDGRLWFTQVTGRVIAVCPHTLRREVEIDLRELVPVRGSLGWCRGIEVVGARLFVGMTMLRATRHREVLRHLVQGPKHPTRIVEIDLDGPRWVREIEVGNSAGGTIYGVLAPPEGSQ